MILVLIGTVPLIIVNRIILISSASNELQSRIARVQAQWNIVVNQVSKSGYVDNPQNEVIDSELVQMANLQDGRALVVNRSFKIIKDTYEIDAGKYNISESVLQGFNGISAVEYKKGSRYISFAQPVYGADGKKVTGVSVLLSSTRSLEDLSKKLEDSSTDTPVTFFPASISYVSFMILKLRFTTSARPS